ncbi:heavy metal translocatin [Pleurotus eryngii]|uniref:Heavy metal translocatin n=1 Tax=Pleurotus eryngii TaxID=5323 RepID=A0A9P5ZXV6_PLEER|nr:heavy metal translocatin [Pleurotus eryngii]
MSANPLGDSVTTVLVSNLHCSSCVHTIESALHALTPRPRRVEVSIVSQAVTVHHDKDLSSTQIECAIADAGFDVVSGPSKPSGLFSREKHLQQCTMCREDVSSAHRIPPASDDTPNGPFNVVFSVGGMTCSSCANSITQMMSQMPGVTDISVSFIEKSAKAVVDRIELAQEIADTIDDCGFEAQVVSVHPVRRQEDEEKGTRTVTLKVDGMFCKNCPPKVSAALEPFGSRVEILKPLNDHTDPIITIKYTPDAPDLTIRHIIAALASAKSPPFNVYIHHPPSLEQLSRALQRHEQRRLLYRLVLSIVIAIPTFIIGIVYMTLVKDGDATKEYLMQPIWSGNASRIEWSLFFLATPVMFYCANLFHTRSMKEIRALWRRGSKVPIWRRFIRFGSMNLLVSTAVTVAYFSSVGLLATAARQPPTHSNMGETTTYFDAVVFLTMFLLAGRIIEAYSKARTADAVTALGSLRPSEVYLLNRRSTDSKERFSIDDDVEKADSVSASGGSEDAPQGFDVEKISAELLEIGDVVRVPHGATPPADGVLIMLPTSEGAFDESSLTGEAKLIKKQAGDRVFLGTINKGNMVHARIDSIGGETMLDRIVNVVREGQTKRAPIERIADMITGYFVPVITLIAILTWIIWLSVGLTGSLPEDYLDIQTGGWPVWSLGFAIAVFVVACPCGIGLAAPTALLVGSGLAAKFGILARGGGEAFQEMAQVDLVVFDKTGTLTQGGEPKVSDAHILPAAETRWSRETILGFASELESASSHPLALAIRAYCKAAVARTMTAEDFDEVSGRGMKAHFPSMKCTAIIGNEAWMEAHEAAIDVGVSQQFGAWRSEAKSVVLMALREEGTSVPGFHLVAIFAVADPLREEAPQVISWLQTQGIQTWIISGDNATTATAVAHAVGIPTGNVIAGVLPHEKAEKVRWLQLHASKRQPSTLRRFYSKPRLNQRCIVAMVGDGINDAPALTAADIGIAIGSGSDVAISSASFILLSSNLRSLITLHDLSRKVFNRVLFNFFWAFIYNAAAIPIAAGVVYPAGHTRLDPVWASLAMALSSVSVVCSSLLLKLYKEPKI